MNEMHQAGLDAALNHGIDLWGRRVFLHGDIEESTIALAIRGVYLMADMDRRKPIELYVSSYGGEIEATFALHDVTRTVQCPVHTIALGTCMSAAPLLVACGAPGHRYATPNTEFMLHTASVGVEGALANVAGTAEAIRRRCKRMDQLLARYTARPYSHWARFSRKTADTYFGAEEALEWGLVDAIWSEKD